MPHSVLVLSLSHHPIPLRVSLSISGPALLERCGEWTEKSFADFYFWISSYMGPKSNKLISLEGASKQVSKKWTVTVSFHLFFVVWRKRTVLTISIGELMSYISLHLLYHSGLSLIKRLTTQSPKVSLCHCSWPEFFEGDCCRSFDVNWSNNLIKLFLMKISEDQPKQDLLQEEDEESSLRSDLCRASCPNELPTVQRFTDEIQGNSSTYFKNSRWKAWFSEINNHTKWQIDDDNVTNHNQWKYRYALCL